MHNSLSRTPFLYWYSSPWHWQAAYLPRIGDYSREQLLLETALAANRTAPAGPQESAPTSLPQQRSALFCQLALFYLAGGQHAAALEALKQLLCLGDSLPVDGAGSYSSHGDSLAQRPINSTFPRAEALVGVGRPKETVAAYGAFLEQRPQLIGAVEEFVADALLTEDELSQAASALRQAANHTTDRRTNTRLLDRLAGVLESMERWNEATRRTGMAVSEIVRLAENSRSERETKKAAQGTRSPRRPVLPTNR